MPLHNDQSRRRRNLLILSGILALVAVAMIAAQMTRMHRVSNLRWAADEARNAYMAKGTAEPTSAFGPV